MLYALQGNPLLRPGDAIVVSAGGRGLRTLQTGVTYARMMFPDLGVMSSCSPKRLPEIATLEGLDTVLVDWEPSTVESWDWDFRFSRDRIDFQVDAHKLPLGLLVTAVPLNRRKGYAWDYRELSRLCRGPMVAQTQGFLKRSPLDKLRDRIAGNTPFEEALMQLKGIPNAGFQVAFNGDAAVSPQVAVKACRVAEDYGLGYAYLFGMQPDKTKRFLELLRGVSTSR